MRVGILLVNENKSAQFVKTRQDKIRVMILALLMPIFFILVICIFCWWKNVSFKDVNVFYFVILLLIIGLPVGFDIYRSSRIAKDYDLEIVDGLVFLNRRAIGKLSTVDRVFIQPIVGWDGIGETYTVGIIIEGKRWCLSFNNTEKENATEIANELCLLLKAELVFQRKKIFTLYLGY